MSYFIRLLPQWLLDLTKDNEDTVEFVGKYDHIHVGKFRLQDYDTIFSKYDN